MKTFSALLSISLTAIVLAGCNGQLDHIGRPPSMTAPGTPPSAVPDLAQQRRAVPPTVSVPPSGTTAPSRATTISGSGESQVVVGVSARQSMPEAAM